MRFRVEIEVEDVDHAQLFSDLSACRKLATFIKIAVDAYMGTNEGERLSKVLSNDGKGGVRKHRGAKPALESAPKEQMSTHDGVPTPAVQVVTHDSPAKATTVAQGPIAKSTLELTDSVLCRVIKPMNRE